MTKRKHEEESENGASGATIDIAELGDGRTGNALPGTSRREMQGQGDKKHTIDSDDEEEERQREKQYEKMKDDDIEGQEDNTLNFDGDIQITPFNLKEEQQEGSFSKDGNFVWNDKKEEIKDAWLDDIDWVKVKQKTAAEVARQEQDDDEENEAQHNYSELDTFREMLTMLKPGESVARALRRLGGGSKKAMSASERWKKKKAGLAEDPQEKNNKEAMLRLTGLADSILTRSGMMEIYEETFESINFKLQQEEEKKIGSKTSIPEGMDDEDALDMFADSLEDKLQSKTPGGEADQVAKNGVENGPAAPPATSADAGVSVEDEVMWEFKWKNEEDAELHGPHSSQKMLEWQESGFFAAGVWCRKVGTSTEFASSKRIDFDLYT